MAANDIITDMGSFRQLHGIIRGIERAVAAVNPALDGGIGTGHRHLVVAGFAAFRESCVHAAADTVFIDSAVTNRAVDDGHAAVTGCTRCGVTAVNVVCDRAVRDRYGAACIPAQRITRADAARGCDPGEGQFITGSVTILGIAGVQITRECRSIGKDYRII